MNNRISVVVVDDHPMFRSGVVASLREYADMNVIAEGASAAEAVELVRQHQPDVALLDISMPGNGLTAVAEICATKPHTRIVMLTVSEEEDEVFKALDAGAAGYALKGIVGDELVSIVRTVASGAPYLAPILGGRLLASARNSSAPSRDQVFDMLTPREKQIAQLLTEGLSNKEIGKTLNLQEKTVKHHMTQIMQKLGVRNRVEAAMMVNDRQKRADKY